MELLNLSMVWDPGMRISVISSRKGGSAAEESGTPADGFVVRNV